MVNISNISKIRFRNLRLYEGVTGNLFWGREKIRSIMFGFPSTAVFKFTTFISITVKLLIAKYCIGPCFWTFAASDSGSFRKLSY